MKFTSAFPAHVSQARKGHRCCPGQHGPVSGPGGMSLGSASPALSWLWWLPSLKFIGIITYEKSVPSEDGQVGDGWQIANLMIRLKYAKANK